MGLQANIKTREDLAYEAFLKAESAWFKAQKVPLENFEEIDAAYQNTIALYDSVITEFPGTQNAVQALYAKASILADEIGLADSAKKIFSNIIKEYPQTPWGKAAREKLSWKLSVDGNELIQLRKRLESFETFAKQQSETYWREAEKKQNEPPPPPKVADDEILRNDYNTLYDFK
jgi:TolA-binding protein